ncbi:MAG: type II/IV secretion system protein, partial [Methylobacillus glycogenes]|nr:type II/IV secretion system protein [Methylobacillus glycogenes]
VTRLLDLGIPSYLIHSALIGIMAQRLVRTLCIHCKTPTSISQERWNELVGAWKLPKPEHIQQANGCLECRMTGFRGRSGIYEMLPINQAMKKLITHDADLTSIKRLAYQQGMQPLLINGMEKVAAGLTTIEELLKVAPPPFE